MITEIDLKLDLSKIFCVAKIYLKNELALIFTVPI